MPEGYWSQLGPLASVDWCEANYAWSIYVAEWWNTLSSFAIVAAALAGLAYLVRLGGVDTRFFFALGLVALVGLGSVAFHGTLLLYPQAADELPMIYTGLTFTYVLRFRRDARRAERARWIAGLGVYGAAFTAAYFLLDAVFVFFIVSYAALVAYVAGRSLWISIISEPSPLRRRLVLLATGAYCGGVFFLWIPENLLFSCEHPIQSLQLHAWFHLTSAVGSTGWVLWALHDQRQLPRAPAAGSLSLGE